MLTTMEPEGDRAILALVGEVMGVLELEEFQVALLAALQRAVPSDWVSLNGIAPHPGEHWVVMEPAAPDHLWNRFQALAFQNPLIQRLQRTQDGRAYRFSDVATPQQLHATELWRDVYAPLGVAHQIAFTLPAEPGWLLGVALSRRPERPDYSDAERALLNDARRRFQGVGAPPSRGGLLGRRLRGVVAGADRVVGGRAGAGLGVVA